MSRNTKAKYSKELLYPLFEDYAKSDEDRTTFCERHKIGLHNYNYWWAKYRKEKGLLEVSKNRGRKKGTTPTTATQSIATLEDMPPLVSSSIPSTGTFIKMEDHLPVQNSGLTLRTHQGIELRFEQLPPISYLQQLLQLSQNH